MPGAGKSSLVKVLAGVERPDAGEVRIDGSPLPHGYGPHVAHRLGLAFVHQELGNFPTISVAENVALGTRYPRRLRERLPHLVRCAEPPVLGAQLEAVVRHGEPNACIGTHRVNIGGTVIVTATGCEELNHIPTTVTHKQ